MAEPDVSDLLTVARAIDILDHAPVHPRVVEMSLPEALGLRLAEDLSADRDYPPFDKSLMDGFAVRCADVATTPVALRVIGEIAAGAVPTRGIEPGETVAIMTGAPLPPGADGVVPIEDVAGATFTSSGEIQVLRASSPSRYLSRAGSDMEKGRVVLPAGAKLEAAQLAVAATIGAAVVKVYAAPRVALFATGDEIVSLETRPGPAQIRNSNNIMLSALLKRMGCRVVDLGLVPDDPHELLAALARGMQLDVLLVTGGMSMGRHDHIPPLLRELGVTPLISKLRIKPGKPFLYGAADRAIVMDRAAAVSVMGQREGTCHVFGLPGNPVSGFACTVRLVSRLLARLAGGLPEERWLTARLSTPLGPNGPREFYQPILLDRHADEPEIRPLLWKGSADLFTLAQSNALLVRPENDPARAAGDRVRVLEFI